MKIKVGDKVRLTGKFLRSTGQQKGSAGLDRWTVTGISGSFAITNEQAHDAEKWYTSDELKDDPTLRFRRIALFNLEVCK